MIATPGHIEEVVYKWDNTTATATAEEEGKAKRGGEGVYAVMHQYAKRKKRTSA